MGFRHAYDGPGMDDPIAEVAFKPYTHVEVARDVRADLMDADGKLNIAGQLYDVHPLIRQAIIEYPSYYYAGAVGPDGFPDIVEGQAIIHSERTGIWLEQLLNKAWSVQDCTPEEKLQIPVRSG